MQAVTDKTDDLKNSQQSLADTRIQSVDLVNQQIESVQSYVLELRGYLDSEGKVNDAHKQRAEFLTNEINNLIPGAVNARKDESGAYYEIRDSINELIVAKQREMLLESMREQYTDAVKNQASAYQNYVSALQLAAEKQREYNGYLAERENYQLRVNEAEQSGDSGALAQAGADLDRINEKLLALEPALSEANGAVADAKSTWQDYQDTIVTFNEITAATTQEQLTALATALGSGMKDAISAGADATYEQIANMQLAYEQAVREFSENAGSMTEQQRDAAKQSIDAMASELSNGVAQAQQAGIDVGEATASGVLEGKETFSDAVMQLLQAGRDALNGESVNTDEYGKFFAQGIAQGITDNGGDVSNAAAALGLLGLDALAAALDSHSPSHKTMQKGQDFDSGFAQGISSGEGSVLTAVGLLAQQTVAKLTSVAPQFQTSGQQAVSQIQQGVNSNSNTAVAAIENVANSMLSSAKTVTPQFSTVGVNMAQGLMSGISQMAQRVATSAANLAKSALQAAKDAVGIKSPSRAFRDQVGRMMAAGMAIGIENGDGQVKASVAMLSRAAFEDARDNAKDFKEIGDLYVSNLTYGVEKGRDAALDQFERWIDADVEKFKARKDATDEQKKSYEDAANEVMTAYKSALNDGYDEALDTVKTRVSELTAEFKSQHDALIREQESMQNKLSGFGDLFTIGKDGSLALEDINKNIDAVKRYDDALTALKERGVSDEFMQQVTGLGVEEGTKFAEKLTKLPDDAFDSYTAAWQEQQDLAKAVAEKFYQDQLETLETEFSGKLDETLESVPTLLTGIGQDSIQGMIDGMYSKSGALSTAASEIVSRAISAMRMAADIHSPSRKTRELVGKPLAEGIAVGFDKQMSDVYRQISQTLDGEVMKLSADVKVQAERQAAQNSPAPVQTVFKSTHTVATPVIEFKGELAQLGRFITPVVRMEEKRIGGNMVKGEA